MLASPVWLAPLAVSINTISPTNEAYISGEKSKGIDAGGDVTLSASDTSTIQELPAASAAAAAWSASACRLP